MDLESLHVAWTKATGDLAYGVQHAFHTVLSLVEEGKKQDLVWGADYNNGPCLVNSVGNMLVVGGGNGIPTQNFGEVVSLYDRINREFRDRDINTNQYVSPMAADILLQWYAPLKEVKQPMDTEVAEQIAFEQGVPFVEPTDEELQDALEQMFSSAPPVVETTELPFDRESNNK